MIETQISILAELAAKDGAIDARERDLIEKIGNAHGLSEKRIQEIINNPGKINYNDISEDERFDMLYHVVHLMKVDGQIFDEEISYCMTVAKKLGYPLEAVMELYRHVHANLKLPKEIHVLKNKYKSETPDLK